MWSLRGLFLVMCGLIKKVVIADFIADGFVNRIFENPSLYSGFEVLMGIYGFFNPFSLLNVGIRSLPFNVVPPIKDI